MSDCSPHKAIADANVSACHANVTLLNAEEQSFVLRIEKQTAFLGPDKRHKLLALACRCVLRAKLQKNRERDNRTYRQVDDAG
jgi:hypothetical protein